MKWIIENWSLLVLIAIVLFLGLVYINKFANLPSDSQLAKVKNWLLFVVIQAEKEFKSGTGKLKLSYVYSNFVITFPDLARIVTFEQFSKMVDEVLVTMRNLLETNMDIAAYVGLDIKEKERVDRERYEKGEE